MKSIILLVFLTMMSANFGSFAANAQKPTTLRKKPIIKDASVDIANIDFKNFTFPDLLQGMSSKTFTLNKGQFRNGKLSASRVYTLRKTYYFDITGDGKDEAVTHILAEGCGENCDSHSFFYVHKIENNQPKLIWQIATGSEVLGGLKSIAFNNKQIIIEAFGSCMIQNSLIFAKYDAKNPQKNLPSDYTRFVLAMNGNIFSQTSRDILPFQEKTIAGYRAQISFGEKE